MIKLDDDLLKELGLAALPPEEKKKLLAHIYETLEMRVGMKLAEQMSDAQLSEFEQFIDSNNESGALQWLETNFPNYKDVVAAEFDLLKKEIQQIAPQIAAASNGQQSMQSPQAPQPYQQYQPQPQQYGPPPAGYPQQPMPPQPPQPYYPQPGQPQYGPPQPSAPQPGTGQYYPPNSSQQPPQ